MNQTNGINWTEEEWRLVALRAASFRRANPEIGWSNIVIVCQDDIAPERRRVYINKLSALRPMFEILNLDETGNPLPPPPPPPPEPEPLPLPEPQPVPAQSLANAPTADLLTEVLGRGDVIRQQLTALTALSEKMEKRFSEQQMILEGFGKRIDGVELQILSVMETMDKMAYAAKGNDVAEKLLAEDMGDKAVLSRTFVPPRNFAPVRFLLVGVLTKSLFHIQKAIKPEFNVELSVGDNDANGSLPANVHYCLVSGHNDCSRRFVACRDKYGSQKVIRLPNGAVGTFSNEINRLAETHIYNVLTCADRS